jgi:hypothetical protein
MRNLPGIALTEAPPSAASQGARLLQDREEWLLACRIAGSRGFGRSDLLKRFLLDVCEQALLGNTHEITEQRIGMRIFGRQEGYDPGEDNIVRSYARTLRKRLDAYFAEKGIDEPLRLTIPRGGYVPVFEAAPGARKRVSPAHPSIVVAPSIDDALQPLTLQEEKPHGRETDARWHWGSAALGLLAGAVLALLVSAGARAVERHRHLSSAHALWAQMFARDRNTLIVPADSGLGILENLTKSQANVDAYANGAYFAAMQPAAGLDAANLDDLSRQHYTSAVDLSICTTLERLPEFTADRTQIRYPRSLTADELHSSSIILLGSAHSNPWVALFDQQLNFRIVYTPEVDHSFIQNEHPESGEQTVYRNGATDHHQPTYGTVSYLPDAGGTGRVLIVQGLNMAATQAAADIFFSASAMEPVLRQADTRDGQLRPFELLVETTSIGASAPAARIVAMRVYPRT